MPADENAGIIYDLYQYGAQPDSAGTEKPAGFLIRFQAELNGHKLNRALSALITAIKSMSRASPTFTPTLPSHVLTAYANVSSGHDKLVTLMWCAHLFASAKEIVPRVRVAIISRIVFQLRQSPGARRECSIVAKVF